MRPINKRQNTKIELLCLDCHLHDCLSGHPNCIRNQAINKLRERSVLPKLLSKHPVSEARL